MTINQLPGKPEKRIDSNVYYRILRMALFQEPLFIDAEIRKTTIENEVGANFLIEDDHAIVWGVMIVSEDCDPDVIVAKNEEMRAKGVRGLWYWVYQNKTTSRKAAYLQEAGITIRLVILDDRRIPWLATPSEEDPDDVYLGIPLLGRDSRTEVSP